VALLEPYLIASALSWIGLAGILGYHNRDYLCSGHKRIGFLLACTVLALLWPFAIVIMIWIHWPETST
jgi:hypothetical protein